MDRAAEFRPVRFRPGDLVAARGREWVVLPETRADLLKLRPLGGAEEDAALIYLPLEAEAPRAATFDPPDPEKPGDSAAGLLLRDALRLKLRAGAGPFRSFGRLGFAPHAYQLVPLLMALRLDPVRLLIADDVGVGKTVEAGLIARELLDRGEIERLVVICPAHLCEQWQRELTEKFGIEAEVVLPGTAHRLERDLPPGASIFEAHRHTVVSLDYIKSDRRRADFLRACPEFVIVDEAHTCAGSNTKTRHQRHALLKGLAAGEDGQPRRGMVLLTATPHSGDEAAFHRLLGLLAPKFAELGEAPMDAAEDAARRKLREALARHFVQRTRGDIAREWAAGARFPVRESREATYRLTGEWGRLFEAVLDYARTMVRRAAGGSQLAQRMSWWAALALLRCASSSPAAAASALRTRLGAAAGANAAAQIAELDRAAGERVLDEAEEDSLALAESAPAGTVAGAEDPAALGELIDRADALRGPGKDPKLGKLIAEIRALVRAGFRPAVFCRFIATAHYVGEELQKALAGEKLRVAAITGELPPAAREAQVEALGAGKADGAPVLVATDCLSEGVNLQHHFNAVIHYDLSWNPTRHEQREGRADRYGQPDRTVRTLMLYGENNPVDGAVLRVILRKAERIRKELGVAVPVPANNQKVVEAIMEAVLQHGSRAAQAAFDFGETEAAVDAAWQTEAARHRGRRTRFAQGRLKPAAVLPEFEKAASVLGGAADTERFVRLCAERLGAPLAAQDGHYRLPAAHLPKPLRERLEAAGFTAPLNIAFEGPPPPGAAYIHRAHPLVAALAEYAVEGALNGGEAAIAARCGATITHGVERRTLLYLLRLRHQIHAEERGAGQRRPLLAEECLGVAVRGGDAPALLSGEAAFSLLSLEASRNMPAAQKTRLIRQAVEALPRMADEFGRIAQAHAERLGADHRRVRDASGARGLRYRVEPVLPVDPIGVYVFIPPARM